MDLDHAACYRVLQARDRRFDGRLFVAVKTTGIYCRPICPARTPKSVNVIFFATAAAAATGAKAAAPKTTVKAGAPRGKKPASCRTKAGRLRLLRKKTVLRALQGRHSHLETGGVLTHGLHRHRPGRGRLRRHPGGGPERGRPRRSVGFRAPGRAEPERKQAGLTSPAAGRH